MQYTFSDTSRMVPYSIYNNDADAIDFTLDSGDVSVTAEGFLQLELTKSNGGPRISLTRPVYYGTVTTRIRPTKYQGVISSFVSLAALHFASVANSSSGVPCADHLLRRARRD